MGFKILALTFVKTKDAFSDGETDEAGYLKAKDWINNQPNVIFSDFCRGLDMNAFSISLHYSYHEVEEFVKKHNREIGQNVIDLQTVLVDLSFNRRIKAFDFSSLADAKQMFDK